MNRQRFLLLSLAAVEFPVRSVPSQCFALVSCPADMCLNSHKCPIFPDIVPVPLGLTFWERKAKRNMVHSLAMLIQRE